MAEPRARQNYRGEARILDMDGKTGANELAVAGTELEWLC
jgi:hypothetical protein